MCLITFAYKKHPTYKLIVAANRDEFYNRPTRSAQFWIEEKKPSILAGKDLKAGGTWMGISKNGKWAALTNYRDPNWKLKRPTSRGEIALNFLVSNDSTQQYLQKLERKAHTYLGFNVVLGDKKHIFHFSNYDKTPTKIKAGIYGLSNALLDTLWPKLERVKLSLTNAIQNKELNQDLFFSFLGDDTQALDHQLPKTGIPKLWEKALSPPFITTKTYGTMCSTLLLIDYIGTIHFTERRFISGTHDILEENTYSIPT